jgi:hypothetical protein
VQEQQLVRLLESVERLGQAQLLELEEGLPLGLPQVQEVQPVRPLEQVQEQPLGQLALQQVQMHQLRYQQWLERRQPVRSRLPEPRSAR